MRRLEDEALILGAVAYGESDKVVTLLCREHGKLSAFAPGARKSKRRFAGALEPGTRLRARLLEGRGETLRLEGVDVMDGFGGIRESLESISHAMYALELVRELVREREAATGLYLALTDYLGRVHREGANAARLVAFELEVLSLGGFRPVFERCVACGGLLSSRVSFDAARGGTVCGACSSKGFGGVALDGSLLESFHALQRGEARTFKPGEWRAARRMLGAFVVHHLGRSLKSQSVMESLERA